MNNNLKLERTRANLTQEQLAVKIGVTRQTIGLIEKGKYNPSLQLCLRICVELQVTLNDIFWIHNREEEFNER
ncbi:helix-turn-helix transcriptional regulator [Bacillus atrophaeus]|uniref:helix-turn-helix transcriptional regulator n=1 Tax=Bacillus atrophaeus TaxID=1452 RepID=UPI000D02E726|nr:helix-turn-helix transcriptional regulator [Bacillus atrophaeus]PRS01581.1 transcriptional regulator [Bacillus atrophaeus]